MGANQAKPKAPVRRDPDRRFADGATNVWRITNQDPTKHYVAVYESSAEFGVEAYEYMGYDIVIAREGGPSFFAGRTSKLGEPVRMRGHVLMSIDKAKKEEIDRIGPDGATGQALLDDIDSKILDHRKGGFDPGRGLRAQYISFENEIQEAPSGV